MAAYPAVADRNTLGAAARHPARLVHIQRTPRSLRSRRRAKSRRIHRSLRNLHTLRNLYTRNRRTPRHASSAPATATTTSASGELKIGSECCTVFFVEHIKRRQANV